MLILSHLDRDHVNGLPHLLKHCSSLKMVVLPYLHPLERLFLLARATFKSQEEKAFYLDFIADPYAWFQQSDIQLVIVDGDEPDTVPDETSLRNIKSNWSETREVDSAQFLYKSSVFKRFAKNELKYEKLSVSHASILQFQKKWFFRFFNKPMPEAVLQLWQDELVRSLQMSFDDICKNIKQIIFNQTLFRKLKKSYRVIFCNGQSLNPTSLIVYHGPILPYSNALCISETTSKQNACSMRRGCCHCRAYCSSIVWDRFGTFLLGDITLDDKILKDLERHFGWLLETIKVISLPHHGASSSWDKKILEIIKSESFWIASSQSNHRLGHPHPTVIADLVKNEPTSYFLWSNEKKAIHYYSDYYC